MLLTACSILLVVILRMFLYYHQYFVIRTFSERHVQDASGCISVDGSIQGKVVS